MNLKISVARGMKQIKDLPPGSVFIMLDKIAVKRSESSGTAWECVVLGTGDNLFEYDMDPEKFNELYVTPIKIYEEGESE